MARGIETLLEQLKQSLDNGQYFLSLFTVLAVPDICGALASNDGRARGSQYAQWFDAWVRPRFKDRMARSMPLDDWLRFADTAPENPLDGRSCYLFRCSLLHQGRMAHPDSPFARIMFLEPQVAGIRFHYVRMDDALMIDLVGFCEEVIDGASAWLGVVVGTEPYETNIAKFATRHPNGLAPYVVGVPLVA